MNKLCSRKKYWALMGRILVICLVLGFFNNVCDKPKQSIAASGDSQQEVWNNGTMMQYFEWYLPNSGSLWDEVAYNASSLSENGFTAMWLPPAYKADGQDNVGYGAYDLYDLGEFNQKGTVRTKYGTKDQYLNAINTLHNNGIQVYADVVLNHKAGADGCEQVSAVTVDSNDRNNTTSGSYDIDAWTKFDFSGRGDTYSAFKWNASCFDGVDYDNKTGTNSVFRFSDKNWDWQVDTEYGNYDYLMFADVDFDNSYVVDELNRWGKWYVDTANLDGFRLDAVKHIKYEFYEDWLTNLRNYTGKELFTVGEYWSWDVEKLKNYIAQTGGVCSLFDVPLHFRFADASNGSGNYDMRYLFNDTLVEADSYKAVTFVENHDTQYGQALTSPVAAWFKPLAYTAILTREGGYPCVFYGDYYGTGDGKIQGMSDVINKIMKARKDYAYGTQHDYLDDANVVGWTREGDSYHVNSGLAALITDGAGGSKNMYVGTKHAGEVWYDVTGNISSTVTISNDGYGYFSVNGGSHSIYIPKVDNNQSVNNKLTIYYKTGNSTEYIHYKVGDGSWTTAPGVAMTVNSGYGVYSIDMGQATTVTACFNDGAGNWDNNGGSDYTFSPGTYTVDNSIITSGEPQIDTEPQVENDGKVTIYYYTTWRKPYIHYKIGEGAWTAAPGVALSSSSYRRYYVITIDLQGAGNLTACFNNGNNTWDNNNTQNYQFSPGIYTVVNGTIKSGTP